MRLFRKKDDVPKRSIWQRIKDAARTDFGVLLRGGVDEGSLEALETLLLEGAYGRSVAERTLLVGNRAVIRQPLRLMLSTQASVATWMSSSSTRPGVCTPATIS